MKMKSNGKPVWVDGRCKCEVLTGENHSMYVSAVLLVKLLEAEVMLLHCVRLTEPSPIQQHQQQQKRQQQQQQKLIFHVPMTPGGLGRETATNGAATTTSTPGLGLAISAGGQRGMQSGSPRPTLSPFTQKKRRISSMN